MRDDLLRVQRQRAQLPSTIELFGFGLARCQVLHTTLNQHAEGSDTVKLKGQLRRGAGEALQVRGSSCGRRPTRSGGDAAQLTEAKPPLPAGCVKETITSD